MTGPELIALGHAAIARAHELILLGGALGLLSIIAGLASRRVGAPMLLVFLALGMIAGEDGLLGLPYDDFESAYLIGSVALAVILFEGGLKTPLSMFRLAFWPAAALATIGVAVTAAVFQRNGRRRGVWPGGRLGDRAVFEASAARSLARRRAGPGWLSRDLRSRPAARY